VNLDRDSGAGGGDDGGGGGGPCSPEDTQCNNCIDDDGDTLVDGDDPECTGALDDDEGSFATGIPGDNIDEDKQDCFFDGNSGSGDDGCSLATCCLLEGDCPPEIDEQGTFDRATDCDPVSERCIAGCAPLAPPGCDCFGCCTICDPVSDECSDVLVNPAVSPDCALEYINDPELCRPCLKDTDCTGGECDPALCILCPGQTVEDLPDDCNQMNACPDNGSPCDTSGDCNEFEYCSNSCCVEVVD
jgi:hypothetical protein